MKIFKRKRVLSILLALCMALSLLPGTALAGGEDVITTYQQLTAKIAEMVANGETGYIRLAPADDFGWPGNGTLTIPANIGISCTKWEIPNNITVQFERNCSGISGQELLINGTIHTSYSSQDSIFSGCNKVVIGPTGTFSCATDTEGQQTGCGQRIAPGKVWEVLEGGTLNARIRLGGTLTGAGTVSGQVSVQGGFSGTSETDVIMSGNLTITSYVSVGYFSSLPYDYSDKLTIPAGSNIYVRDSGTIFINSKGTLKLGGNLEISNSLNSRLAFEDDGGVLDMAEGSIMTVRSPGHVDGGYELENPCITGSGTILLYKSDARPYFFFSSDPDNLDRVPDMYNDRIATTVTVNRTWICDEHQWSDWAATREATCGTSGEKSRTCSACGAAEFQYVAPTGQHSWNTSTWVSDSTGHWHACANCEETTDAAAHTFGDWTVTQEATATEAGSQYRDCTVCGYRETGTIPATGEPDSPVTPGGDDTPDIPTPPPTVTPDNPYIPSYPSGGSGTTTRPSTSTTTAPASDTLTKPDDSTTTKTDAAGNTISTIENPNGSIVTTVENKDGGASTTTVSASGQVTAAVTVPAAAVAAAQASSQAVALPMPEVPLTANTATAPVVTVTTGSSQPVKVEIPVEQTTPGTVAIIVNADGTEEVVKTSLATANGVTVTVADGATVKIVDNSKSFSDTSAHWASDAIAFATAHELFNGTGEDRFTPDGTMTRGMLMTVLARYGGVDTSTGAAWYEKGVEWAAANNISSGEDLNAPVSREQLATMLYRYAAAIGLNTAASGSLSGFPDAGSVSEYAVEAMAGP